MANADSARVAEAMKQTNQITIGHYILGKPRLTNHLKKARLWARVRLAK